MAANERMQRNAARAFEAVLDIHGIVRVDAILGGTWQVESLDRRTGKGKTIADAIDDLRRTAPRVALNLWGDR
jgi:hypothetical protein